MICKFNHDGDCCNSGAMQYMCKCKQPCATIIPMTNEDKIRSMTDEELADFLRKGSWMCCNYKVCRECIRYIGECCLPIDEWLKQPAKEED